MALVALQTPPRKGVAKPRRDVDLSGLWQAWEDNRGEPNKTVPVQNLKEEATWLNALLQFRS